MGGALYVLMPRIEPWFVGTIAEKAMGIGALVAVGVVTYGAAGAALGILDKATVLRLMRRAG